MIALLLLSSFLAFSCSIFFLHSLISSLSWDGSDGEDSDLWRSR